MRRVMLAVLVAVAVAACDSDSPTAPSPDPNVVTFRATLLAANEVPAVTGPEATGRGNAVITMRVDRDGSNNITGATFDFVVNLNSFPAGTKWTLAHIHEGGTGVAGGVRVNTGLTPTAAVVLSNGSVSNQTFSGIRFTPAQRADAITHITQMIANPGARW